MGRQSAGQTLGGVGQRAGKVGGGVGQDPASFAWDAKQEKQSKSALTQDLEL